MSDLRIEVIRDALREFAYRPGQPVFSRYEAATAALAQMEARVESLEEAVKDALRHLDNLGTSIAAWCPHGYDSSRSSEYGWAHRFDKDLDSALEVLRNA